MKSKLTKTFVAGLAPTGKRVVVFDTETSGFALRMSEKGEKSFYYHYRPGRGRQSEKRWLRLGSVAAITCEQARLLAKKHAGKVSMGIDPAEELRDLKSEPVLADVLNIFMEEHVSSKRKPSTLRLYKNLIDLYILEAFGKKKIGSITVSQVAKLHHDLREKPYMANRCLAVLSKFFNWCELHGYRDKGTNPANSIDKFKEHKRTRFMGESELSKLGSAMAMLEATEVIDAIAIAAIRLLLFTGARLNEILSLQWSDVDLNSGIAHIADSKTGAKTIHLASPALAILNDLPRVKNWVFPSSRGDGHIVNLRKNWVAVCKNAGLEGWRLHDLRHAFASAAVNAGHSLPLIGGLLGHGHPTTTSRYAHVGKNPVHAVAEDTAKALKKTLSGGKVVKFQISANNG